MNIGHLADITISHFHCIGHWQAMLSQYTDIFSSYFWGIIRLLLSLVTSVDEAFIHINIE